MQRLNICRTKTTCADAVNRLPVNSFLCINIFISIETIINIAVIKFIFSIVTFNLITTVSAIWLRLKISPGYKCSAALNFATNHLLKCKK